MMPLRRLLVALVAFALLAVAAPGRARADGGPFGIGLIIGSPTGISAKYYLGESGNNAIKGVDVIGRYFTVGVKANLD